MALYNSKEIPPGMSRRAFKKQCKQERMEAEKEDFLERRRVKRRELRKSKSKPRKRDFPLTQTPSGIKCVLDCSFDDLMEEGEVTSLAGQVSRCYSANRRSSTPVDLEITGFNKRLADRFNNTMQATHKLWQNIEFKEQDFEAGDNVVYLTGDAEATLDTLDPGFTYIIGGIVDKDRYKNLCLNKAQQMGVKVAKLPISEHIKISGRRILTTNQAFELVLKFIELKDWTKAFESVIPMRKLEPQVTKSKHKEQEQEQEPSEPEQPELNNNTENEK